MYRTDIILRVVQGEYSLSNEANYDDINQYQYHTHLYTTIHWDIPSPKLSD